VPTTAVIELRFLGPPLVKAVGRPEAAAVLAQPKRFALLAYLAAASPYGYHRRDTLLALFWPEADQTEDLKAITVPTLVLHGEDDQVVPIAAAAAKAVKLLPNAVLKTYPGFSHGMLTVNADVLNADLLAFVAS
jgi:pimeloyl-ACP methyl ester carboxylesterase